MRKQVTILFLMTIFNILLFKIAYTANSLIDQVSAKYSNVKSIKGSFTQKTILPDGKTLNYKGYFTITTDSSEWIYTYPEKQKIITKGKEVFIIKGNKIEKAELMLNTNIYSNLIKNIKETSSEFNVVESGNRIMLIPRNKNTNIERIIITVNNSNPKRIEVADKGGSRVIMDINISEAK